MRPHPSFSLYTVVPVLREFSGTDNASQADPLDLKGTTVGMQKAHRHPGFKQESTSVAQRCILGIFEGSRSGELWTR